MTLQPQRTRSFRRVKVKLPGGRLKIHYTKRKPKQAHCSQCRRLLHGVPRELPVNLRRLPKVQRRPERIFGGFLCPSCTSQEINKQFNVTNEKIETGRLVVKTAGRDAGKIGVIIDILNDNYVLLDGNVRRKKCNIDHISTLDKQIKIKPKASTETVINELKAIGIDVKKTKPKTSKQRPRKQRKEKTEVKKEPKIKKEKPAAKKKKEE